jgi:hypothetical protein
MLSRFGKLLPGEPLVNASTAIGRLNFVFAS